MKVGYKIRINHYSNPRIRLLSDSSSYIKKVLIVVRQNYQHLFEITHIMAVILIKNRNITSVVSKLRKKMYFINQTIENLLIGIMKFQNFIIIIKEVQKRPLQ